MPDAATSLPKFASILMAEEEGARVDILKLEHADYTENKDTWSVLIDAFEGTGGFLTGEYIWRYRHETADDYKNRKAMARYHNYVETIVDLYTRHLFSQPPKRTTTSKELEEFWQNVDGAGTDIDSFLRRAFAMSLAGAHVGILLDKTKDEPTGPAKADQKATPFLVSYPSTSITDWRLEKDTLTGIKLLEAVTAVGIADEPPPADESHSYLLWDKEGWARFDHKGTLLEGQITGLDLVPLTVLRPKPSVLKQFIGRSLFSNANIIKALYNRMSEEDQVLRDQMFSILTVEVAADGDVEAAKKHLGEQIGTSRATIVQGKIKYEAPSPEAPAEVRANIVQVIRELYRVAHMRFERDSLDAESAEAIRLQYTELNEMLQGCAAALQQCEEQIARFFFAWTSVSPEAADAAFEASETTIEYADEFFLDDLLTDLTAWAQALKFGLGDTMTKRIKKRAVRRIEPEMPPDVLEEIDQEIDSQPEEGVPMPVGAEDDMRAASQSMLEGMGVQTPQKDRVVGGGVS